MKLRSVIGIVIFLLMTQIALADDLTGYYTGDVGGKPLEVRILNPDNKLGSQIVLWYRPNAEHSAESASGTFAIEDGVLRFYLRLSVIDLHVQGAKLDGIDTGFGDAPVHLTRISRNWDDHAGQQDCPPLEKHSVRYKDFGAYIGQITLHNRGYTQQRFTGNWVICLHGVILVAPSTLDPGSPY